MRHKRPAENIYRADHARALRLVGVKEFGERSRLVRFRAVRKRALFLSLFS